MTKPTHYMFGLIAAIAATAALLGGRIVPEKGRLPFESDEQALRKEERFAQRKAAERANGRMLSPGRGDFRPRDEGAGGKLAQIPTEQGHLQQPGSGGAQEAVDVASWRLLGRVEIERARDEARPLTLPWSVHLELVPVGNGAHQAHGAASTACEADGTYALEGLLPGLYRLRALPRPQAEDAIHALPIALDIDLPRLDPEKLAGRPQKDWPQDLVLPQPRRLFGRVFQENQPRPGVRVAVHETGLFRGTAVSDVNGRFEIDEVGGGPWRFEVEDQAGKDLSVDKVNSKDDFEQRRVEASIVVLP